MRHSDPWIKSFTDTPLQPWLNEQLKLTESICSAHGDYKRWQHTLTQLAPYTTDHFNLSLPTIQIGQKNAISKETFAQLKEGLSSLQPWRKGPFNIFGVEINSEWRSDFKWQRIVNEIAPLRSRNILDVGCGNGYSMLRMLGEGAKSVIGIDPTVLFNMQFKALTQRISENISACILPVGINALPDDLECFDSVFSMGILYHRRSPIDHLR